MAFDTLWIPITVCAALAQTGRNAAQRQLTQALGTLGATWVRFVYGLPFALLALAGLQALQGQPLNDVMTQAFAAPGSGARWTAWMMTGAVAQILATAALLRAMDERGFALGVAYAKTEILMVAVFGLIALGDRLTPATLLALPLATLGVLLLAPADPQRPLRALVDGWASAGARFGLLAGLCFSLSAVAFRGATLQWQDLGPLRPALGTLAASLAVQTLLLGAWLLWRQPQVVREVLRLWRPSLGAGALGALASACWFSAFALQAAAPVRTLGLVELVFSLAVSRRVFRERLARREALGMGLLAAALVLVTLGA